MFHRICSLQDYLPSCWHVSTRPNSYMRFDWSVIFRVRIAKNVLIFTPDPKNNRPIKSHVGIRPRTDMSTWWKVVLRLQILWSIALKLQISKDDDKKESKYTKKCIKNIFIKLQMSTNIMANQVKTPIQNYFEKVLYENLTFEIVVFSSPDPKGHVRYCHYLAFVVRPLTFSYFNLLLWNNWAKWQKASTGI
jgi:hypothetical protein